MLLFSTLQENVIKNCIHSLNISTTHHVKPLNYVTLMSKIQPPPRCFTNCRKLKGTTPGGGLQWNNVHKKFRGNRASGLKCEMRARAPRWFRSSKGGKLAKISQNERFVRNAVCSSRNLSLKELLLDPQSCLISFISQPAQTCPTYYGTKTAVAAFYRASGTTLPCYVTGTCHSTCNGTSPPRSRGTGDVTCFLFRKERDQTSFIFPSQILLTLLAVNNNYLSLYTEEAETRED